MIARAKLVGIASLFSLWAALGGTATAQDAASQIKAEIARHRQSLKDSPVSDPDFAGVASAAGDALQGASDAVNEGHMYLALEKLGMGVDLLQGSRAGADKSEVEKGGLPAFEAKWGKASLVLTELDRQAQSRDWSQAPAAIRALAEAAQGRSLPLLEGGRGFATATGPKDGLLYVGQAEGEAGFAKFCAGLSFAKPAPPLALRSMLPELVALQQKTNAAFQPPRSIDLHSRFIMLNSALKLAEELDARKFYAGALYQYLEAVRNYGMLDAPLLDAGQQSAVKDAIVVEQQKLAALPRDVSIAQLFLERAGSYVAHTDGSAPTADEWRSARVIVDQVLPAYFAAEKPAAAVPSSSGRAVTITLVRWPYT